MSIRDNIQDELKGLDSNLPSSQNSTPYTVPEGYFEGFAASVLSRIKAQEAGSAAEEIASLSPLLASISRTMPYEVPKDYFQINIEVLPAITADNEESLILSFVEKEMPYEVPKGYFANLPEQVVEKIETSRPRVVKMGARKWMRLAVAAMIAGIITLSGIAYFNNGKTGLADPKTMATRGIEKDLKTVSTEELKSFIKTTTATAVNTETAQNSHKTTEVKALLEDVSDKELDAFLNQLPSDDTEGDIVL